MSKVTDEFRSLVADCQVAVDKTEARGSDWNPPATEQGTRYNCLLKDMVTGAKNDGGKKSIWIRLVFQIMDGDYKGKDFNALFTSKQPWRMNDLFGLASLVSKDPSFTQTRQVLPAVEALSTSLGKFVIEVNAKKWTSRSSGASGNDYSGERIIDEV